MQTIPQEIVNNVVKFDVRQCIYTDQNYLYFANIGPANLASEIETQLDNTIDFSQYMGVPANTRLQFKCITETETLKAIDNLENKIARDMMVYLTNC